MAITQDYGAEFSKKSYEDLYWEQGKSLPEIAKELKVPYSTIQQDFMKFRIKTRTKKQAIKLWWKRRKIKMIEQKNASVTPNIP